MSDEQKEECESCHELFDADELIEWTGYYFNGSMVCDECAATLAMEE